MICILLTVVFVWAQVNGPKINIYIFCMEIFFVQLAADDILLLIRYVRFTILNSVISARGGQSAGKSRREPGGLLTNCFDGDMQRPVYFMKYFPNYRPNDVNSDLTLKCYPF